ncbi:DUF1302 family protein [Teredinibacter sp. KSP-S5-2]|uniref:DUF1302 family protein n=1 Tax=Teredinibacter sp. KSP-S5-2 TaxID=3034506 RepID=UPI0029351770|nr:DUF1302 family protein [Teredinibacter sp. KSP-S5-2]WNO11555.1 hypothetical protein P5V12_10265 [Teredinibacter sp. KSP-S5-2]
MNNNNLLSKEIALLLASSLLAGSASAQQGSSGEDMLFSDSDMFSGLTSETATSDEKSFLEAYVLDPSRVTLSHELGYKVADPDGMQKNRSSIRIEYGKYLFDSSYIQLDGKSTRFHEDDHRHEAEGSYERLNQAYIQTSFGQTSIKLGVQTIAWGESILAPITDEISPRDNRELFNLDLEELRIGQAMLSLDQFSDYGKWSIFINPDPEFNENPIYGTAYNPISDVPQPAFVYVDNDNSMEYGGSWKQTFGSFEFSAMAASLIDNDYARKFNSEGLIELSEHRYFLGGATFNYVLGDFLLKGEFGYKSPKVFSNKTGDQLIEKKQFDAYLGIEYAPSSTFTMSVEGLNQHILDWTQDIEGTPGAPGKKENQQSLMLNITKLLMHENLSLNFISIYNGPQSSYLSMFLTDYEMSDNITLELDFIYPHTDDEMSTLWRVKDQKQVSFKVSYQF